MSLLLALLLAGSAPAADATDSESRAESWERTGWGGGALPAPSYNTDEGFGMGAIGSLYRYDGSTAPYKWKVGGLIWMSTKGVHAHHVDVDVLELAGGPLRLTGRLRFEASRSEAFCGLGGDVTCDVEEAEERADQLGLEGEAREDFIRRYYAHRYMMPYGLVNARWRLREGPPKVEALAGYRLSWYTTGDFSESGPWPGSTYDQQIDPPEQGFTSVLQAGIMADTRDNEPSPTRGYWVEGSVRGASPLWGSDWAYFGFNTTLRGYLPLAPEGRLVLADRLILDGILGDASSQEMTIPGGFQVLTLVGGARATRGISLRRYRGRAKVVNQLSLRWKALRLRVLDLPLDIWLLGFLDAAHVALEWDEIGRNPLLLGEGVGLRLALDENFVVRFDVGVSAVEGYAPQVYIDVDNLF